MLVPSLLHDLCLGLCSVSASRQQDEELHWSALVEEAFRKHVKVVVLKRQPLQIAGIGATGEDEDALAYRLPCLDSAACVGAPSLAGDAAGAGPESSSGDVAAAAAERLSVLLDCPQLRSSSETVAVSQIYGLDAAPALLALMPGCIALLFDYQLGPTDEAGYATAFRRDGKQPAAPFVLGADAYVAFDPYAPADRLAITDRYRRISNGEIAEVQPE